MCSTRRIVFFVLFMRRADKIRSFSLSLKEQMKVLFVVFACLAVVLAGCSTDTKPVGPSAEGAPSAKLATETTLTPEQARAELTRRGVANTAAAFLDSAGAGNLAVIQLFVQAGLSVDTASYVSSFTALQHAAWGGQLEVVKYLVERGADVNAENGGGSTALHLAAAYGQLEVVKYLVGQGAIVTATDNRGRTPRSEALVGGHPAVVRYLDSLDDDE